MADGEAGAKALNASRMGRSEVDMSAPDIAAAWTKVVNGEATWIALGYTGKTSLGLLGSGSGCGYGEAMRALAGDSRQLTSTLLRGSHVASTSHRAEGLRPMLADDKVVYGAFRLAEPSKLVFVASVGCGGSSRSSDLWVIIRPPAPLQPALLR